MIAVDTLVVMATNRGQAIFEDQLEALRWGFERSFHLIVVDDSGDTGPIGWHGDHSIIRSRVAADKKLSGFKSNEGLAHAVQEHIDYKVAMVLDDDALIINQGLDTWALELMEADAVGLLGVQDRVEYTAEWPQWAGWFAERVPEANGFVPMKSGIFYAANWMHRDLVNELASRGMLVPTGHGLWNLWPDVYISWLASCLGYYTLGWGAMDRPRPPLYCNHPDTMGSAPPPWALRAEFMLYHSIRSVPLVKEAAVRAHYAQVRAGLSPPYPV